MVYRFTARAAALSSAGLLAPRFVTNGIDSRSPRRDKPCIANVLAAGSPRSVRCEAYTNPFRTYATEARRRNEVLALQHRVGLCAWPIKGGLAKNDPRVQTADALFKHVADAGYDGVEVSFVQFKGWYVQGTVTDCEAEGSADDEAFVQHIRDAGRRYGVGVLGATYHIMDGKRDVPGAPDFSDHDFEEKLARRMTLDKKLGAGYVNFQIFLPPKYMQTPLAWRDDEEYLRKTVERSVFLRNLCWKHGLNAYFETHIDRWGEDPVFFRKVLADSSQEGGLEANGDLSHYLYRGWTKGCDVEEVLKAVNHLHVRIARVHGDLSANTPDPFQDFASGGPTRAQWDMILRTGPLSSRTICGEAGPLHLVDNTLDQDARIVPMLRAIATAKDGSMVHLAADFNPFSAR